MTAVFIRVFSKLKYLLIALIVTFIAFTVAVWLPNFNLIASVLGSNFPLSTKLSVVLSLYGNIHSNFTFFAAIYTTIICGLIGINVSLLWFYIKKNQVKGVKLRRENVASVAGLVAGLLGIGCAACGAFLLTYIFGIAFTGIVLAYLPLHGAEFGLLGVSLLGYSVYLISKKIADPLICPIDK